jgi:hypothetical protein
VLFRIARWHILKPEIPIWVNFGGSCNGKCWYITCPFSRFYGYLVYYVAVWYIILLGIFFPFWYVVPRKIWRPWWCCGDSLGSSISVGFHEVRMYWKCTVVQSLLHLCTYIHTWSNLKKIFLIYFPQIRKAY